jgi:hypothetical protein
LDSTKLAAPGQIAVDFSQSGIKTLLGFTNPTQFLIDGLYAGNVYPAMDLFGNTVSLKLIGFGPLSVLNGGNSYELCSFDLTQTAGNLYTIDANNYVWIDLICPDQIKQFKIELVGSRNEKPVMFMESETKIIFAIRETTK